MNGVKFEVEYSSDVLANVDHMWCTNRVSPKPLV